MGKASEFAHCTVCRRNHEQGKRHRYSASHQKALEQVLAKALDRIQGIRSSLESPVKALEGGNRFWCWFCSEDVVDRESLFAWSKGIYHLASSKHMKNVKRFCFENGADIKNWRLYCFTNKEVEKWEAGCNLAEAEEIGDLGNNIHNTGNANFASSSSVQPLPVLKDEKFQVSIQQTGVRETISASGESFASVNVQPLRPDEGNVHSGALPPWMSDVADGNNLPLLNPKGLTKRKEREIQKLDKRVGAAWAKRRRAELELNKSRVPCSSNWLPSFGRVWQSGTRSESKKEFECENSATGICERDPPKVEPYVGKRKQRTPTNGIDDAAGLLEVKKSYR